MKFKRWFATKKKLLSLAIGFGLGIPMAAATKAISAERIYIDYGALEFSLSVESLEAYVREGRLAGELASYADYLDEQQREQLRAALTSSAEISPVAISQFLYSPQGEQLLKKIGQVIQTAAGQSGFYALRSALIMAAADEEGLTALNVIKQFPTSGIRLNSKQGFEIVEELSNYVQQTQQAIASVETETEQEIAREEDLDFASLPIISQRGNFSYEKLTFTVEYPERDRDFPVDLYLPQSSMTFPFPVVVISHGLGSSRDTFAYLARYLASHGFAVAVPEHPGSSYRQIEALFQGFADQVTPPRELINRPYDIQLLLDALEESYAESLNLKGVGVIGQSFGGYTALAVAGADLNFDLLEAECENVQDSLNVSLLLQCIALELPQRDFELEDPRIGAAIAINPLTSAVFGQEGLAEIDIPIMIVASSADPVTPALSEQIIPFTWLTESNKYLLLLENATHFSALEDSTGSIPVPERAIGPDPQIARNYVERLSLAFFQTYIARQPEYRAFLTATYAQLISDSLIPLSLVRSLSLEEELTN